MGFDNNMENEIKSGETCIEAVCSGYLGRTGINGAGTVRGIQIDPDGWRIAHLNKESFKRLIDADEVDTLAIGIRGRTFGCMCDHDGLKKELPPSTVVRRGNRRWYAESRPLTFGPLFVYLNSGLSEDDIIFIGSRIPCGTKHSVLVTQDLNGMLYTDADP